MASIHIEQPIKESPEDLLKRFEQEVLSLPNLKTFVDSYEIQGNRVTFGGSKGISGAAEATPGTLIVDVTLSGMTALMKPFIEGKLREVLSRLG